MTGSLRAKVEIPVQPLLFDFCILCTPDSSARPISRANINRSWRASWRESFSGMNRFQPLLKRGTRIFVYARRGRDRLTIRCRCEVSALPCKYTTERLRTTTFSTARSINISVSFFSNLSSFSSRSLTSTKI